MFLTAVLLTVIVIISNICHVFFKVADDDSVVFTNTTLDANDVCSIVAISVRFAFRKGPCKTKQCRIIYVLCLIILCSKS